jgi:transposase InsO family protein
VEEVAAMSAAISSTMGRPYGVERVCATWGVPRSSFYAWRHDSVLTEAVEPVPTKKRGPKTELSDQRLLVLIREDLASSPFHGEGHRKVWARLRIAGDVHVSRKRVLRIMRENHLLAPCRGRRPAGPPHTGEIITTAPNEMWGTDGIRVLTVEEGWGWAFTAVEHWNAECVGWHVCKTGDRFAALEPISLGLDRIFGRVEADVARGLSLRMDHGTQYLSDHFVNQVRFWGIRPSFAFVEQPQTNGVAERFNRTLREQALTGKIFRTLDEVRKAVADFVERYNQHWRLEKLDYLSPVMARLAYAGGVAA